MNQKSALLLIDLQQGFDVANYWGRKRSSPDAENVCQKLLAIWRGHHLPIFYIRHNSTDPKSVLNPSHAGFAFKAGFEPQEGEALIDKTVNSAFIGTDLKERLHAQAIKSLVIVGLTTNHCVSTTARMAGNLGFEVFVVKDATGAFDRAGVYGEHYSAEEVHRLSLTNLQGEFAQVLSSDELLEQLKLDKVGQTPQNWV